MSNNVSWNLQLNINDGSQDAFRSLMEEMVAATREEAGALCYEWFISDDGSSCHINERYADSAAMMVHLGNFGATFAERFMSMVVPTAFVVYGEASDEVKGALAGFGPAFYGTLGGFNR